MSAGPVLTATAWQTVGPYWSIGMDWPGGEQVGGEALPDSGRIVLSGRVLDAEGVAVEDAVLEVWQADTEGRYPHPEDLRQDRRNEPGGFVGFGRCGTAGGGFAFTTVKPGRVPAANGGLQAPHLLVSVFARGILSRLVTRIYFADEANEGDPVLALVPAERRDTLIARPVSDETGHYRWDVRLQGEGETVFFRF